MPSPPVPPLPLSDCTAFPSYRNKHEASCPKDSILFHAWNDGSGSPIVGGFGSFTATAADISFLMHAANGTVLYRSEPKAPRKFD